MEENVIREVDDAVRQERLQQFWRSIRKPVFTAAAVLIAFTAGMSVYKEMQREKAAEFTQAMFDARRSFDNKDYAAAARSFETIAAQQQGDRQQLARYWQAQSALAAGKPEQAREVLENVISGAATLWRDMGCIALLSMNTTPYAQCDGSKESPLAVELRAARAAQLWQSGKHADARLLLERVANDERTPPDLRSEAHMWLRSIQASAPAKKEK